jgi:hypothetical protein
MEQQQKTNDGNDETKHQKRRRKHRSKNERFSWTLFFIVFGGGALLLLACILVDHNQLEQKKHSHHTLKRARQIMEEREWKEQLQQLYGSGEQQQQQQHNGGQQQQHGRIGGDDRETEEHKPGLMKRVFGADDKQNDDANEELRQMFRDLDRDIRENIHGGIRWIQDKLLRELPGQKLNILLDQIPAGNMRKRMKNSFHADGVDFKVNHKFDQPMAWETEWKQMPEEQQKKGPKVDYTKHEYQYPDVEGSIPEQYPFLDPMEELLKRWPQDSIDDPPSPFIEKLMHFNYSDPNELRMAEKYRNAELPFKVYDVPELKTARAKWTDDYVAANFDGVGKDKGSSSLFSKTKSSRSQGNCQESHDNFFAFFTPIGWQMSTMGPPPYRNNDWTYEKWSTHARYADATGLSFDQPHFYWQAGVPRTERYQPTDEWGFVSQDLPMFSSTDANFFQFEPEEQKGIQCRFGERGVTAATHYDAGRNMIAMITGAKRYILSPPRECGKLGIVTARGNTLFRHSLLNFGHISYLDNDKGKDMPSQEKGWLERSKTALAVETVLKAGEVLYIPSHWFHYITSVQKSAQCNVRSGVNEIGTRTYGGSQDVYECKE